MTDPQRKIPKINPGLLFAQRPRQVDLFSLIYGALIFGRATLIWQKVPYEN